MKVGRFLFAAIHGCNGDGEGYRLRIKGRRVQQKCFHVIVLEGYYVKGKRLVREGRPLFVCGYRKEVKGRGVKRERI